MMAHTEVFQLCASIKLHCQMEGRGPTMNVAEAAIFVENSETDPQAPHQIW